MNAYTIYTDGACHNNGKPNARAGWGAVLTNPQGDTLEIAGPVPEGQPQTNGRAELMAVVEALERCTQAAPITLNTDSEYIAKAFQSWLASWMRIPRHPATQPTNIRPPVPRSSGQAVGAQRRRFALLV